MNKTTDWYIDSGASAHMTNERTILQDLHRSEKRDVLTANNEKMSIDGVGNVSQLIRVNDENKNIVIENVQYIPKICANLLSVSQIVLKNLEVVFNKKGCTIFDEGKNVVACGSLVDNLFKLNTVGADMACKVNNIVDDTSLWHRRLGMLRSLTWTS